jgi:hypothetical protein
MMLLGKALLFFQRANNSSPVRRIVWNCDFWAISNSTGISFVQKEERRMVEASCSGLTWEALLISRRKKSKDSTMMQHGCAALA